MKRIILLIIAFLLLFAQSVYCADSDTSNVDGAEVFIKYYNKTIYYPGNSVDNPIYIHITVANHGDETVRFKLADDRMFSIDFSVYNIKGTKLSNSDLLLRKRTTSRTVYFREIALESGEEYSFVENLKDYIAIDDPSMYYVDLNFYPELYKTKQNRLVSNRMNLEIKPSVSAAGTTALAIEPETVEILIPEHISPDQVVEQTIVARQRSIWDQYFLYMDVEQMLMRDPSRNRKYRAASADERTRMINNYKLDLSQARIDKDIVSIPEKFSIERTVYSQTEGTVTVLEWFKNDTYWEKKRYTYFVRQRDGIWQIYDYNVENLGTE